jgi:alanine racemase
MDAWHGAGQARALISRSALLHNVKILRQTLAAGVKICAMVKADAYGHAAAIVADALTNGSAAGYLRSYSNRAKMLVHGKAVAVVGRVSMDTVTVDLADVSEAKVGDVATVLDCDPLSPASVYALAEIAATIPYEVFTRIGARVTRVAVDPADSEENETWPIPGSTSAAKSA